MALTADRSAAIKRILFLRCALFLFAAVSLLIQFQHRCQHSYILIGSFRKKLQSVTSDLHCFCLLLEIYVFQTSGVPQISFTDF